MERICAREFEAFEELYRDYRPRLGRFLMNLVHRPQLAEEIYDDTMLTVWSRPENYRGAAKLSTWIFAIAYRKALKALRRVDDPIEADATDMQISKEEEPDQEVMRRQLHIILTRAISELSPVHRAVVDLVYSQEMGYREIAEILGCPVNTVKTRMLHARRHMRERLGGRLADWL